jgi:hypothetical protein
MALGSTQLLTEMSIRNLPGGGGGKRRPGRKADNLTAICEPPVYKMWEPRRLITLWAPTACYRDTFNISYIPMFARVSYNSNDEKFASSGSCIMTPLF